jgi:hypothetical protein
VVVVSAGRKKGGLITEPLSDLEAKDVPVERQRPVEAGDFQVNVSDSNLWVQGTICHDRSYIRVELLRRRIEDLMIVYRGRDQR